MTDRYNSLTVILAEPIRSDDAQPLIDAIGLLQGVQKVIPGDTDNLDVAIATERVRHEYGQKLWEIIYPKAAK